MKFTLINTLLAFLLVSGTHAFAQQDKNKIVTGAVDVSVGNGGLRIGVGPQIRLLPELSLTAGAGAGADLQFYGLSNYGDDQTRVGAAFDLFAGLILKTGSLSINPLFIYKCEDANPDLPADKRALYGCASRLGIKAFYDVDKVQFGLGYSRSITNITHGEQNEFQILFRAPISSNDEERNDNKKKNMHLNNPIKEEKSQKAAKA